MAEDIATLRDRALAELPPSRRFGASLLVSGNVLLVLRTTGENSSASILLSQAEACALSVLLQQVIGLEDPE